MTNNRKWVVQGWRAVLILAVILAMPFVAGLIIGLLW